LNDSYNAELKIVSTPGRVFHYSADKIPFYKNGYGFFVMSTSCKGVITCYKARKYNIGGLCLLRCFISKSS
jgi:ribosomal protein S8